MTRLTIISLNPDEYNQVLCYCQSMFSLDRSHGSCNTFDDPSGKICAANKTEDIYLNVFNMVIRINESKTLTYHISCECKCEFCGKKNLIQIKMEQMSIE